MLKMRKKKVTYDISEYENLPYIKIINRYVGMEELAMYLSKCAISVCPYTDATQSGVIMTCFSLCKPVIATNVGGLGEMIENGRTGILIPPKDINALASSIIELLSDNEKCNKLKENIKNDFYHADKSWNKIVDKYIDIYNA